MKIYFWKIDEESEWIAINEKGGRHDIVVQIGENYYPQIDCVDYQSFILRCNYYMETEGYYNDLTPRTILVKEVTKDCIIETIKKLALGDFFKLLKPKTLQQVKDLYKPYYKYHNLGLEFYDDWHVVYDDGKD